MNELDILIGVIILASAVIGAVRGFIKETLSLASWILAFAVAWTYAPQAAELLTPHLDSPSLRMLAAFIGLFFAVLLVASICSYILRRLVAKGGLGGADRSLGFLFGIARGGIVVSLLVLLAGVTSFPEEPWWRQSALVRYFETFAVVMLEWLPPDVAGLFKYG